ncbi:hypothetical protein AOLI_G00254000 [Acnodon oligacanthus]
MDGHGLFLAVSVLSCLGHGWVVQVPESVKAVEGSCVKISCQTSSHREAKWYKYKGVGYPVVYSRNTADITAEFRGRTSAPGRASQGDCSLQIANVRQEDNGISLYPWIYPQTSSNRYKYIQINVVKPEIHISVASPQTDGNLFSATCTVRHSCPSSPPPVQWMGLSYASNGLVSTTLSGGLWTSVTQAQFRANRLDHSRTLICKSTFNGKSIYSPAVTLNIIYAPTDVTVDGADKGVVEGAEISLTCTSKSNPEPTDYEWLVTQKGSNTTRGAPKTFPLGSVKRDTSVSCTARNSVGRGQSAPALLNVHYAPTDVKVDGADKGVVEGAEISLTCTSKSNPEPTDYEWLVTQKGSNTTRRAPKTFPLGSVKRDTSVSCTARNSVGRGQSAPALLNVHFSPTILMDSTCFRSAGGVRCVCRAEAEPKANFVWTVNGRSALLPHFNTTYKYAGRIAVSELTGPLASNVSCKASNIVGTDSYQIPIQQSLLEGERQARSVNCLAATSPPPHKLLLTMLPGHITLPSTAGQHTPSHTDWRENQPPPSGPPACGPPWTGDPGFGTHKALEPLERGMVHIEGCKCCPQMLHVPLPVTATKMMSKYIQVRGGMCRVVSSHDRSRGEIPYWNPEGRAKEGIPNLSGLEPALLLLEHLEEGLVVEFEEFSALRQRPADSTVRSRTESSGKNLNQFKTNDLNLNDNIYMNSAAGEDIYANTMETNKEDCYDIYQNY